MKDICLDIEWMGRDGADGVLDVFAPGFFFAELFWADKGGRALTGWTNLAHVPLTGGKGTFAFTGGRAVPEKAETVLCRAVTEDGSRTAECTREVPGERKRSWEGRHRFAVASDLHISNKAGPLARLYDFAVDTDGLLLAGDTVNDGTPGQFKFVKDCVMDGGRKHQRHLPIFAVAGNHDMPLKPLPSIETEGQGGYPVFQRWLQERVEAVGNCWNQDVSGAYAVPIGESIELIGLQCVSHYRRFVFRGGKQLEWLERHLDETDHLRWHVILCHAPLLGHNPQRSAPRDAPYLSRDEALGRILDAHHNIIFISGHTHFSLNNRFGCVDWDGGRNNLYLNAGSIRKTTMHAREPWAPPEWTEGCAVLLGIGETDLEITTVGLYSGNKQARGYYCLHGGD